MKQIAQILLFDRSNRLIIYLRDDKPGIPFPNHWDLIGGHVEEGETPEQALRRETKEEIGIELKHWDFYRRYDCFAHDAYPNSKFIYHGRIDRLALPAGAGEDFDWLQLDPGSAGPSPATFTLSPILDPGSGRTRTGHLWVYLGDAGHPYAVFDFSPTYSGDGPRAWLGQYAGYVQADGLKSTTRTNVPLKVGQRHTSSRLDNVAIQDLRVYGRALAPAEVERLARSAHAAALLAKPVDKRTPAEKNRVANAIGWLSLSRWLRFSHQADSPRASP